MNLKKLERYLRVNLLGPGRLIKKRIYWAAVSQRFRNTVLNHPQYWKKISNNPYTYFILILSWQGYTFTKFCPRQPYQMCLRTRYTLKFLSPTNAPLYYTYKMLKCTVKISHDCSYMFRSFWTIIREPMPNLAKVTILWRYSVKIHR
jgi:hypothetical protein